MEKAAQILSGRDRTACRAFLNTPQAHLICKFAVTQSNKPASKQLPLQIKRALNENAVNIFRRN